MSITRWKSNFYALVWLIVGAWQFTWHNKVVILLGGMTYLYVYVPQLVSGLEFFAPQSELVKSALPSLLFRTGLYFVLILFSLWGKAAIIHFTVLERTKERDQSGDDDPRDKNILRVAIRSFANANESMSGLLRFLFLTLFVALSFYALWILIGINLARTNNSLSSIYALVRTIIPMFFITFMFMVWHLSIVALIVNNLGPTASLKRGVQVLLANFGSYALLYLSMYVPFALGLFFFAPAYIQFT